MTRRGLLLLLFPSLHRPAPGTELRLCGMVGRGPEWIKVHLDEFAGVKVTLEGQEIEIPVKQFWEVLQS